MKVLGKVKTIFDRTLDLGISISAILIFFSWCVICFEVVMRQFFNRPQVWVVEVVEYMMLYSLFLGAAWVLREEEHIKVDLVLNLLKPEGRALVTAINSVLGAIVCLILTWYGTKVTWVHYREGLITFTAMLLPKWPFLMVIPFGSFLLFIQFVRRIFGKDFRKLG
ncbi:MAG: hypothetical protein DRG83_03105 [Deltaproteobacteria bacterium]|nr:MAG: hypothetical protein DRG83_03105 [Deltaproteobacteria bacterium]